jgi:SSS family solute:Na+ symporter
VNFGRAATGVLVLLGVLWVPFIRLISSQLFIYLQAVQAYISPPIAVCFIFGILWPRLNGQGAIASLLSGFVLGSMRFTFEVLDKSQHFTSPAIRWLIDMNFLHYAIFMFLFCAAVLIVISLATAAPDRRRLAGLTFATVDAKLTTTAAEVLGVEAPKPPPETRTQHRINLMMSTALVLTVVGLWVYFR